MLRAWWRTEAYADLTVINVPETFASMVFGVETSKLNVKYCVHHVKCFKKMKLTESNYKGVYKSEFGFILSIKSLFIVA